MAKIRDALQAPDLRVKCLKIWTLMTELQREIDKSVPSSSYRIERICDDFDDFMHDLTGK